MSLIHKAAQFYRMAVELSEAGYKDKLNMLGVMTWDDVMKTIKEYQDQPYFRAEDFKEQIAGGIHFGIGGVLRRMMHSGINMPTLTKFVPILVKAFLNLHEPLNAHYYLQIEEWNNEVPELVNQAKEKVIKTMMQGLEGEGNWSILAVETFRNLYERSTLISKDFLMELAKKMDIDTYFNLMTSIGRDWPDVEGMIQEHHQWHIWDIALLYKFYVDHAISLPAATIQQIIQESDQEVKDYMRRWLYVGSDHLGFMLDEDMHPMSKYYNRREWPEGSILIMHVHHSQDWSRIFEEFHVIPA